MTIREIAAKAKRHISNADKFERERAKAADAAESNEEARDREQRAAGVALIQLHKACEAEKESFASAIKDRVGVSRSRAYELIALAGGIPDKIAPKSAADQRADSAARKRAERVRDADHVTDNDFEGDGANVIAGPWPETVQRPARDTRRLEGKLEGDDAEELTGRALNLIREAQAIATRLPDISKLKHFAELANAATRTAETWAKIAAQLKDRENGKARRNA